MNDIKIGDAVRTPRGSVARVCAIEQNGVAVLEQFDLPAAEGALYKSKLTRLAPDTGLEERARKLADRFDADPYLPRWPGEALRALLDAEPEVEPEVKPLGGMECQPDGSVVFMEEEPPPSPPVTKEELADVIEKVRRAILYHCSYELYPVISDLRASDLAAAERPHVHAPASAQVTKDDLMLAIREVFMAVRVAIRMLDHGMSPHEGLIKVADHCESILCRVQTQEEGE